MAREIFGNLWAASRATQSTAPAAGTVETWSGMAATLGSIPALAAGQQFRVVEDDAERQSEIILVTAVSGTDWTVTRGAEGTTPVVHPSGANFVQTLTKAILDGFQVKTIRVPHTFTISGDIMLNTGDLYFIPGFYVPVPDGQKCTIAGVRCRVWTMGGASYLGVGLYKNDAAQTSSIPVTAADASPVVNPTTFADGDELRLIVEAITGGTPKNMQFTVYLDYQIGL